jgi:hypothetical protein
MFLEKIFNILLSLKYYCRKTYKECKNKNSYYNKFKTHPLSWVGWESQPQLFLRKKIKTTLF